MSVTVTSIKEKAANPIVATVLTVLLAALTVAGIAVCTAPGGVYTWKFSVLGKDIGGYKWSFNEMSREDVLGTFIGLKIEQNQCSGDKNLLSTGFWACMSLPDSLCLPPNAWTQFTASKISAVLAIVILVIIAVLFIMKKHNGCSICGLFWLALILTSISAGTASAGAITAMVQCGFIFDVNNVPGVSTTLTPGSGVSLLIAAIIFQFIVWIIAQCTANSGSSPTVVVMSSGQTQQPMQYPPQQYPPQQYSPQQYPPQQYAPQQYAPQQYAPQQYAPQQYAPQQYAPAPQQYAPQQQAPQQYAPQQQAPQQ